MTLWNFIYWIWLAFYFVFAVKKTSPLFSKWLYYGLATIFSSVMLAVMADIAMDLTSTVAGTLFTSNKLLSLLSLEQGSGIMNAAAQQLGLGLILSTLLIVVPPMAGMWFNGVMGQYYGSNYLGGWNGGQPPVGTGANSGAHGNPNPLLNVTQKADPRSTQSILPPAQPSPQIERRDSINQASIGGGTTDKQTIGTHGQSNKIDLPEQGTFRNNTVRSKEENNNA